MINPKIKDEIVKMLVSKSNEISFKLHIPEISNQYGLDNNVLRMFLKQLHNMRLIDCTELMQSYVQIVPYMELIDFYNRGGFHAQEELLVKNLEKLLYEIETLKPRLPDDRLSNITNIITGITKFIGLVVSGIK